LNRASAPLGLKQKEISIPFGRLGVSHWLSAKAAVALLSIIAVSYLAYGLFYVPALFMDDWTSVIERMVFDNAKWLDLAWRRPLLFAPFLMQYRVLGLHVTSYYLVIWSLYVLMAMLLYTIVNRFPIPRRRILGLVVALLFLVYPTNYTHMYLIQLGVYCSVVLTLLYGFFLLRFAQGGHWTTFALALICLLISLGLYELQVGIASAWALILFAVFRQPAVKRRLSLFMPVGLMGAFALWRTLGYQVVGVNDQYLSQVVAEPKELLFRLLQGYKINLGWGWTYSLEQSLPWVSGAKSAALLLFGVIAMIGILGWITAKLSAREQRTGVTAGSRNQRTIQQYLFSAIIGVVLVGAGYMPVLTVFLPSLSDIGSRFNLFATIGGAVLIASVLMIGALLLAKNRRQSKYLFLAFAVLFVVLGIVTQASVQYHNRVAWREQQTIWHELFTVAPSFKDDTMVLFILPDFRDRVGYFNWQRTPLSASWEASSAIRLLYANATLSADVYFPDIEKLVEPNLTDKGVLTRETGTLTPYAQTVAFQYDSVTGSLSQLEQLPVELIPGAIGPIKLCSDCVLSEGVLDVPLRRLVQE
jgi:hypothetical protein